jgi:hypothetical protein
MIADVLNNAYKLALHFLPRRWAARLFIPQALAHEPPSDPFLVMELLQFSASMEINPTGRLSAGKKKDPRVEAEELMANLKMLIRKASIQQYSKAELIAALKMVLQSYTCLLGTLIEAAVLLFIARTVHRHFDLDIRDDELRGLWH